MNWTWKVKVGEYDPGFHVGTPGELISVIVGALMAAGVDSRRADPVARDAWESAREQMDLRMKICSTPPWSWSFQLAEGRPLLITSDDLPEDPKRYCDGYTEAGSHCPRHLNHLGECR